ncbi:hypothetical protein NM688_g7955 [Phlebia brevispora]|uniref:Uncharacterized protein n=1 Tax=Phlebia brevispora TaxID=194682 RepID=A0ACC1RZ92_9APHY|nr:hypothetical protein NM688_g7955 [Phlebia brevispora]
MDEEPTPKHSRTHSKKRLSDVYDSSFVAEPGRSRKSVNMNDDAAEKRKRRQSARVVLPEQEPEAGPSNESRVEERDRAPTLAKQKSQLITVDQTPIITVPTDVMNANYEEWMKLATDNKINTANTWNFALIDYFHDMSLLRNNTDNSINFQRASCTLDGCVKIWTSRVDSVGTETGKLLNNLANEDGEGGGEGEGGAQKKKKSHRPASTLAKDAAQLRNKKPDLEFRVDPLFRKTCADFDEGGAHGLLMNHLALGVGPDGGLRVVFDASDSLPKDEDEKPKEEPPDEVDLSYLRKTFLPDLDALDSMAISASLYDFSFSKDAFSFDNTTFFVDDPTALDEDDDEPIAPDGDFADHGAGNGGMDADGDMNMEGHDAPPPVEDFFVGDQAAGDDYVNEFDAASPNSAGDDNVGGDNGEEGGGGGPYVPFDPRHAPTAQFTMSEQASGEIMFDYFDQSVRKNWAGPEHWKLRKLVRKPEAEAAAPKARREKKEAFKIDFLTPSEKDVKEIAKDLFAPPTKASSILLPGSSTGRKTKGKKGKGKERDEKRDNQTLPDDMHFSSRQLVTLFLKPKFYLQMRDKRGRGELDDRHEVDEAFWAQAAADRAANRDADDIDATQGGGAIPFSTQFFHDDFDDAGGFDDPYDGEGGEAGPSTNEEEQDLLAATQGQTRRVRPEFVNYAKRAKRVDVRKLKDNIWKNLDILIPEPKDDDEDDAMDTDERPATDPSEARTFEKVITGLKHSYPKEKMDEISTSFCFICLLHLANEQGLKLESGMEALSVDDEPEDKKIGNIWDLKIYRDPNATPAA